MRGVDRLVAVGEIGARQQIEQIVRAGAADDAVGVEPVGASDRFAQLGRRAVGIILEVLAGRAIGGDRLGLGPSGVSFDDSLNTLAAPGAVLLPGT